MFEQFYYSAAGSDHDVVNAIQANLISLFDMIGFCSFNPSNCASDKVEVYLGLCKVVSKT